MDRRYLLIYSHLKPTPGRLPFLTEAHPRPCLPLTLHDALAEPRPTRGPPQALPPFNPPRVEAECRPWIDLRPEDDDIRTSKTSKTEYRF